MAPDVGGVYLGVKYGTKVRRPLASVVGVDYWRCELLGLAFVGSTSPLKRLSVLRTTAAMHSLIRRASRFSRPPQLRPALRPCRVGHGGLDVGLETH